MKKSEKKEPIKATEPVLKELQENAECEMPHIGALIKARVREMGMTNVEFARRINCHRTNVNKIFSQESIDTRKLQKICGVLQYNFFKAFNEIPLDSKSARVVYKRIDIRQDEAELLRNKARLLLEINVKDEK